MFSSMQHIAAAVIVCSALLAPQAAFAQVHIETGGLIFDSFYSPRSEYLVSDANGIATFSLVNAVDRMSYPNMTTYFQDYGSIFQLTTQDWALVFASIRSRYFLILPIGSFSVTSMMACSAPLAAISTEAVFGMKAG